MKPTFKELKYAFAVTIVSYSELIELVEEFVSLIDNRDWQRSWDLIKKLRAAAARGKKLLEEEE